MKNKDFYKDKIVSIACNGSSFGLFDGIPGPCSEQPYARRCSECSFPNDGRKSCHDERIRWAESERVEYEVDWTKVPIDTPIKVWNESFADNQHEPRHFAKYENGRIYTWVNGRTSFTVPECLDQTYVMAAWDYVELTEPHPEWMKVKEAK